jgi:ABC-type antimicrobial peptide transport system permease subunit
MACSLKYAQPPASFVATARAAVQEIDSRLVLSNVGTQQEQVGNAVSRDRLIASVASIFGLFVLLLTSISVYAVQSNMVTQRTREIGIRISLGADRARVLWLILKKSSYLAIAGACFGLAVAFATTRLIASQLYGVRPGEHAHGHHSCGHYSHCYLTGQLCPGQPRGPYRPGWRTALP